MNPRNFVELKNHTFDQMVTIGNQFIAMISRNHLDFYVEIYNKEGKKAREILISNRSNQLFSRTLKTN